MRIRSLRHVIYGLFFLLIGDLFFLQVVQGPRFASQSEKNRIRLVPESAARGIIFDRNNIPLVENVLSFDVVALPQEIERSRVVALCGRLGDLLGMPAEALAEKIEAAPQAGFFPVLLAANVDRRTAFTIEQAMTQLGGITVQPRIMRRYLFGPATGHVMGYVGKMSEQDFPADQRTYGVPANDVIGKSGIERSQETLLRGHPGGMQLEVNSKGAIVRVISYRPPAGGEDVTLTIDVRLQEKIQALFAGQSGAAVVMDAQSGEVLALHSEPAYDPNAFLSQDSAAITRLLNDRRAPLLNRCLNAYAPGSIFKMVTAYAGLSERKITPQTTFVCTGEFTIGNSVRHCWLEQGHGEIDLEQALAQSCNVYFWETGLRVGDQSLARYAHEFGLGQLTGIDLPGEQPGTVPNAHWKLTALKERWFGGDTVNFAIGQGYLLMSPLQAARMVSMIANNGKPVRPYLVKKKYPSAPERPQLRPELLEPIRRGMGLVVQSGSGTGRRAAIDGLQIYGKTGTAEASGGEPHAWFIGYVALGQRTVSFAVFVEHGGHGGEAPVEITRELIGFLKEQLSV